MQTDVYATHS